MKHSLSGQVFPAASAYKAQQSMTIVSPTHDSAHSNKHMVVPQLLIFCAHCRFVKFQSLTCLSIFVASNQGDEDHTRIQKIAIFGQSGETMNVADIKKAGEEDKN